MRIKLSALFLSIWWLYPCAAQDIKPGAMTTALSEAKSSSSVDYTTGTFNYTLPLLNVTQDNIHLPINLNYNARGIKIGQTPGIVGFGWTLSNGSCTIGRTMRGAGPDEDGILVYTTEYWKLSGTREADYYKDVNGGVYDAESDIFTLNLGGQSVKFVLENADGSYTGNSAYIVRPLQETDIKIECADARLSHFTVTDNSGNIYELDAALPSNVTVTGTGPAATNNIPFVTSWVTTKIKPVNNREVTFEYDKEYADVSFSNGEHYIGYNQSLQLPPIVVGDGYLQSKIADVQHQLNLTMDESNNLAQQIQAGTSLLETMSSNMNWQNYGSLNNFMNNSMLSVYENQIWQITNKHSLQLEQAYYTRLELQGLVNEMYNGNRQKYHDYENSGHLSYFANKLLKKINFPGGYVLFSYKTVPTAWSMVDNINVCDRLDYFSAAGDLLRSIVFDVESGSLKTVHVLNAGQAEELKYQFDYYGGDGNMMEVFCNSDNLGVDYWGYWNGKPNRTMLPGDFGYEITAAHGYDQSTISIFDDAIRSLPSYPSYDYNAGLIAFGIPNPAFISDRTPDAQVAVTGTLKTITSNKGAKISLEYEGNEIYNLDIDANIPMGGIRIKSIETSDGVSSHPLKISYKYNFPSHTGDVSLKSTGRLIEWGKTSFALPYNHQLGTDMYVFSQPVYKGTLCEDNSNNGVLYHYVEEIHPDQSSTGYKYPAVASYKWETIHNPMYDHALLAAVDYNAAGKIVKVARNHYAYDPDQDGGSGNIGDYNSLQNWGYFSIADARHVNHQVPQIKKEPVYLRSSVVQQAYPNDYVSKASVGNQWYGINPYQNIYLPNFQPRCDINLTPNKYSLITNQSLLLKEKEVFYVGDYDIASFGIGSHVELDNEKAYLYEEVLQDDEVSKIQNKISFDYENPAHTYVTQSIVESSDGSVNTTRFKYPEDMTDAISQAMVTNNILSPVLEQKTYLSKDGTETLLSTTQNNFRQEGELILKDNVKSSVKDAALQTQIQYNRYDAYGHILEQQTADGTKQVYLWGYNSEYPVANILNTTYDVVKGYINQNILNNANGKGDDDAIRAHLNNLRNIPGALVTTYTYKPFFGMTSETDPNGHTTRYEYEAFGRLSLVRDEQGNILKKYYYSTNGQADLSTDYAWYNEVKSKAFTRTCTEGGTASSITYTVPARTYGSNISQADADQRAQSDIDQNGQAYANANSPCVWYSNAKAGYFSRNSCAPDRQSSYVTYNVPAQKYSSIISQANADALAQKDLDDHGQAYANAILPCEFLNDDLSGTYYSSSGDGSYINYSNFGIAFSSTISKEDANCQAQAFAQQIISWYDYPQAGVPVFFTSLMNLETVNNLDNWYRHQFYAAYYNATTGNQVPPPDPVIYVTLTNLETGQIYYFKANYYGADQELGHVPAGSYTIKVGNEWDYYNHYLDHSNSPMYNGQNDGEWSTADVYIDEGFNNFYYNHDPVSSNW